MFLQQKGHLDLAKMSCSSPNVTRRIVSTTKDNVLPFVILFVKQLDNHNEPQNFCHLLLFFANVVVLSVVLVCFFVFIFSNNAQDQTPTH